MTKKLEEYLDIPPTSRDVEEEIEHAIEDSNLPIEIRNAALDITVSEKIDRALTEVSGIDNFDTEMDDISNHAMTTFKDLCHLGKNVPDNSIARVYEVAGQLLKTALSAKESKMQRKLKTIELQIKKAQVDAIKNQAAEQEIADEDVEQKAEFERNELLRQLASRLKDK